MDRRLPRRQVKNATVDKIEVTPEAGFSKDRADNTTRKRQVTLLQYEHLPAISSKLGANVIRL